jgi:hypothetical protein
LAFYLRINYHNFDVGKFRTDRSLLENVRDGVLAPSSLALDKVLFLLYDELREPRAHLAILEAIGNGNHTFKAIKDAALIGDMPYRPTCPRFRACTMSSAAYRPRSSRRNCAPHGRGATT